MVVETDLDCYTANQPMSATPEREASIFNTARKLPVGERAFYLDGACAGDALLRQRIEELLQANDAAGAFLPELVTDAEGSPQGDAGPAADAAIRVALPPSEQIGDTIDRYKLLEKIGEGGFGVVYVAEQKEPVKRRVALKVIKLGMDTKQVVARFGAERQALALMDHPNIAKVLDAGATTTGRPFFVMELVKGIKLTDYCDKNQLSTKERLDLFIQVCRAIQHAHQKGIIHRDIKPSNILVTLHDGVPVPKVIDFGIAKATQGELTDQTVYTQYLQFIGTPAYMSPEQAEVSGLDIDTRSDIYSLGVLLYELLSGKTPFDAKDLMAAGLVQMRRTIREKEPVRPSTRLTMMGKDELTTTTQRRGAEAPKLISLLRGDLDWIVMKCLEKDRARRYETASGLALDIERHLNNEPVVARPPSTAYRLQKAWRRHKLALTVAAVIAGTLVAGIGASSWQAIEACRARNAERQQRLAAQAAQKEAEGSRQAEKQERLRAERHEAQANHLLYMADMNLAQQAWDQSDIGWLRQLLEETQTLPDRGFEWYYWQRNTHLSLKTLRGHPAEVRSAVFSPDGKRIVTGSFDGTAKVWEAASGRELVTLKGHRGEIYSVAFSPDGERVVTGSQDSMAKVWEAASGRELLTLQGHGARINSVAFSPDGRRVVTGSQDATAKVWDAANGRELLTLQGHSNDVWSTAFSPDGRRIVTGGADRTAKVWDAASGRELLTLKRHRGEIASVAFSPDGQRVVTGSRDYTAKVWEAASGRELLTLGGHSDQVLSAVFSPDGRRIVTGGADHTAKVWEAASGRGLFTLKGHSDQVRAAFSPDGRRIVTGSFDGTAKVWEAAGDREQLTLSGHSEEIVSVAFSPDGQRIVTGSRDSTAKVWEVASGRELFTLQGLSNEVRAVAFSPDGQRIATGGKDSTARVWEAASGKALLTLRGHTDAIGSVAFSPDGQRIVTGSDDHSVKVWDAASGRTLLTLGQFGSKVWSVAFSPDGQRIVAGRRDSTAKVWETASGKELLTLKGHSAAVKSVAFSPDGQRIVTGSSDKTAKVWEAASGRALLTLKGHSSVIASVAFSPDGRRIVTGGLDNTAKVWEAARADQVAAWQEEERAAAQSLAVLRRERAAEQGRQTRSRAGDEGAIKRWLVLAPIALAANQSGAQGLEVEQIAGEGRLRPAVGDTRAIGSGELKWREVVREDQVIDFNELVGQVTPHSVAYAVCYLRSEAEQRGLEMLVGSDDEAKVYLNGKVVYRYPVARGFVKDLDAVSDLTLEAGLNVLVFKVVNETGTWKGAVRFADAQGNPVKGIKVTLDPGAKD